MNNWSSGNTYSQKDLQRMQQEAVERVNEMQARSRHMLEQETPIYPDFVRHPAPPPTPSATPPPPPPPHPHPHPPQGSKQPNSFGLSGLLGNAGSLLGGSGGILGGNGLGGLLGGDGPLGRVIEALDLGGDKLMILVLLFLLYNNNADKKLLLALVYILL